MSDDEDIRAIMQSIERTYRSLDEPDFHFVQRALDSAEWEAVVEELRGHAELEEITDPNSEVCRTFTVRKEGRDQATLQMSFVGPYGVFFRHEGGPLDDIFIASGEQARNALESAIVRICADNGVQLLGKSILEVPVHVRLFDTAPERVRVYQALFTDTDFLPGEYQGQFG